MQERQGQLSEDDFSWPMPGMRRDLVVALIRSLPKALRVNFVPAPNYARMFIDVRNHFARRDC